MKEHWIEYTWQGEKKTILEKDARKAIHLFRDHFLEEKDVDVFENECMEEDIVDAFHWLLQFAEEQYSVDLIKELEYQQELENLTSKERYDRKNTQIITLKLNKNTDADILKALNDSGNKQGYIKQAIREKIQSRIYN